MPSEEAPVTLAEALERLRQRKHLLPEDFGPEASDQDIDEANARLPVPLPGAWQSVLHIANGFGLAGSGAAFIFYASESVFTSDSEMALGDDLRELSPPHLVIGDEFGGDWLTLDISEQTPEGDCPVAWVSHGGGGEDSRWEGIAPCLQWLLQMSEDRARERHDSQQAELSRIRRHNEECRRLLHQGLTCPWCAGTGNIRYLDKSPKKASYFICGSCGRSFRPADVQAAH